MSTGSVQGCSGVRGVIAVVCGILVTGSLALCAQAGKWPWQRRIGKVEARHNLAYQIVTPDIWPEEPPSPSPLDTAKFQAALGALCGQMPPDRLSRYAETLLRESDRFGVDPFLLGALVYHQSGCRPKTPDRETRYGLTRIDLAMHAPHIRGGGYRYFLKEGDAWKRHVLMLDQFPFNQWKADRPVSNLYFAAAFIKVFTAQCPHLDAAFKGAAHRHPVSHFFYGDRVRSAEPEDATLTVRRRFIQHYRGGAAVRGESFRGVPLSSPLDGTPRLLLDYFGNKRGNKRSAGHQGIDIAGLSGEPVRAVARGRVSFAGVDLPGTAKSRPTPPAEAEQFARSALGKGGIWVTLNHGDGFRTCYMHLSSLAVTSGSTVEAGEIIGTLGNSGTTASGPHLHLEFRTDKGGREDPAPYLKSVLVSPF